MGTLVMMAKLDLVLLAAYAVALVGIIYTWRRVRALEGRMKMQERSARSNRDSILRHFQAHADALKKVPQQIPFAPARKKEGRWS